MRLRDEELTWRSVEGEVIILDRRTWAYITINDSGALLWERLAEGATEADLAAVLAAEYEIDGDEARADVERFVGELREHDMVTDP